MCLMLLLPLPALAGGGSAQTLEWRQDGARLSLHSTEGQVHVDAASPEARFGVRSGDRILRVDDTAVRQVEHLAVALRHSNAATAYLLLRRDRRELTVAVNAAAWRQALEVPPPPVPPPPAPPGR
ncbi:PDZ domain-containing protein [Stenotrophomonas sp. GD03908]|uniref:PDZ domain-containing protein n=4 Tax=Stenotrophomonas maltophilia TaxID=40324 RepID=A0AAJ2TSH6_STEMA|nr:MULTISPECIES: PDZ domain-containing protein [Stenotrophomonas]MBH1483165.1 PDZ domain-containing protein [Stenotrophomonas maltophilia]MCU1063326.1 PDZ domain-containing protein [Stenotrophomonas maltophilia]MDH0979547.1 PDZ domain-containing protein [Stenotrophomonas sp. GD03908]MDQ7292863.1 PDZ domain-containing protein [Stenotrophomonas sp. Sm0041]MDZ5764050.1 PDZ domain-containing protein [Stenotrophomonas maltophilia]